MKDTRAFVQWACRMARVSRRQEEALLLIYVDGFSMHAAARAMELKAPGKVEEYRKEGVARLAAQEWTDSEMECWQRVVDAVLDDGDRTRAQVLLDCVRNSQDPTPRPATYDELGRRVASRDPLVDLDTAIGIVRRTRTLPSKLLKSGSVSVSAIG